MAGTIRLQVVTPERMIVDEDAQIVMAPGTVGEFGVLVGHTPFLTTLKTGGVRYKDTTGKEHTMFIGGGFAEVLPGKVTILAESAERPEDIDVVRVLAALERAQKRLRGESVASGEKINDARARAALERAIYRMNLAKADNRE